jgi:AbrB family looped-hinge helix DNA binding protein
MEGDAGLKRPALIGPGDTIGTVHSDTQVLGNTIGSSGIAFLANNVTSKGQVTIPKAVRDRLGIQAGSAVVFELTEAGEIVLRAVGRDGGLSVEQIPREALFLAGKVFLRYRQRNRSAVKRNVLPDFSSAHMRRCEACRF